LNQQWLNQFKISIIEEDFKKIDKLIMDIPSFETRDELENSSALIQEAINSIKSEQIKMRKQMNKIKTNRKFLSQTKAHKYLNHSF
jgi:hypothetical protein